MISDKFVILGALLQLIGVLDYIKATLKGTTKPNRVSWFLWALAPMLAFSAQLSEGVGPQALVAFTVGFGPLLVLFASFKNEKAYWKLGKFDYVCGALSLMGLLLWLVTGEGSIAIFLSILADGFAYLPTIVKSYKNPESESHLAYTFTAANAGIGLLTLSRWSFADYGFGVYLVIINVITASLIKFKLGKI